MPRCKAPETLRNEAYLEVRRNKPAPCLTRGRISLPAGRQGKRSRWAFFSILIEVGGASSEAVLERLERHG